MDIAQKMNPEQLREFLSIMQATNQSIVFELTYANPVINKNYPLPNENSSFTAHIHQRAQSYFQDLWKEYGDNPHEPYRLANLRTDLLTERVLKELHSQLDKEEVILTNGCCNKPTCPTSVFYLSVLKALGDQLT